MAAQLTIEDGNPNWWASTSIGYSAVQPTAGAAARENGEIWWDDNVTFSVRVTNPAPGDAATGVVVQIHFCAPSTTPGTGVTQLAATLSSPIGIASGDTVGVDVQDTSQLWTPSAAAFGSPSGVLHGCFVATANCAEGPVVEPPPFPSGTTPASILGAAQRNVNVTNMPAFLIGRPPRPASDDDWSGLGFEVGNPSGENRLVEVRVRRAKKLEAERFVRYTLPRKVLGAWTHAPELAFSLMPVQSEVRRIGAISPAPRRPGPAELLGAVGRAPAVAGPNPLAAPRARALADAAQAVRWIDGQMLRSGRADFPGLRLDTPFWASQALKVSGIRAWSSAGDLRQQVGVLSQTQRPMLLALKPPTRTRPRREREVAVFIIEQLRHNKVVGGVAYVVYSDPQRPA